MMSENFKRRLGKLERSLPPREADPAILLSEPDFSQDEIETIKTAEATIERLGRLRVADKQLATDSEFIDDRHALVQAARILDAHRAEMPKRLSFQTESID